MRPNELASAYVVRRIDQVSATDFFVSGRGKVRDDQISQVIGQEESIPLTNREHVCPGGRPLARRGRERIPNALSGCQFCANEAAAVAASINVTIQDYGSVQYTVDASPAVTLPYEFSGSSVVGNQDVGRLAIERHQEQRIAFLLRCADRHAIRRWKLQLPIELACLGI